jgi:hypothetical protein
VAERVRESPGDLVIIGIAFVRDHCRQPLGKAEPPLRLGQQQTPPSELRRPPSNAAVTFLRSTAGNPNGNKLSSVMAGVVRSNLL